MRVSRKKFRRPQPTGVYYRCNEQIRSPEVRVIDEDGSHIGVLSKERALKMAEEKELDLVEINPKAEPPTVRIMDFGQFKYQKEKEARKLKAKQKNIEIKGIRLSIRISEHDKTVRVNQAKRFLEEGDKVKVEIVLRGRERSHPDLAKEQIESFINELEQIIKVKIEQPITKQGNAVTAIICKE